MVNDSASLHLIIHTIFTAALISREKSLKISFKNTNLQNLVYLQQNMKTMQIILLSDEILNILCCRLPLHFEFSDSLTKVFNLASWAMSEMVKYRAALWSFYKSTVLVFYHL